MLNSDKAAEALQDALYKGVLEALDYVVASRRSFYILNPEKKPEPSAVPSLIESSCQANFVISGGLNLVPGPWGLVAIAPEVLAVLRNQLLLIYDIGVAHGKDEFLTKELLAEVMVSAFSVGAGSLIVMRGGKIVVRRVSLRVFQQLIKMLGGRVTQQALKAVLAKWVPVIGAAAMATWSRYTTKKVGDAAAKIFASDLEMDSSPGSNESAASASSIDDDDFCRSSPSQDSSGLCQVNSLVERLKLLACLATLDGKVRSTEAEYILRAMNSMDIGIGERAEIESALKDCRSLEVDYSALSKEPSDVLSVLVDMVALARADSQLHDSEKAFIRDVGVQLGLGESDADELIVAIA